MEVISQKKNPLMNREEAWILIGHAGKPTPPRKDIITEVAKHFKAKEDSVIIDKIFSESGKPASRVKVLIYPKADAVPKDKLDKMQIRMGLKKKGEEKPAAGAPAPALGAAPAGAPARDKKSDDSKEEGGTLAKPEDGNDSKGVEEK